MSASSIDSGAGASEIMTSSSAADGWVVLWGRVIVAVLAAAVVARVLYKSTVSRRRNLPPGPLPWPILGNFLSLDFSGLPHRSLHKLSQKYGGLMYLRLGYSLYQLTFEFKYSVSTSSTKSVPCIVISSAEVAKEAFKTHDMAFSERPESMFSSVLTNYKNVTFAPYGAYWRHMRKICTAEFFTQARIASYKDARFEEIRASVREMLEENKPGEAINLHVWLHNLASNNMTRVVLNRRCFEKDEASQQESREYNHVTSTVFEKAGTLVISDYIPYLRFISKWQGHEKAFLDTRKMVLHTMRKMTKLDSRRKCREEGRILVNTPRDFVDVMLSMPSETGEGGLSDESILFVIMDLLVAGTDPSASTIEWAITELIRNPDIMHRAQAELDSVVGPDNLVQESDLDNLPFLQAVLKETFRLHTAVPLNFPRVCNQPFTLAGYSFPAKTQLFLNQWAIHRDPSTYERPEEFIPDRFVNHPEITTMGASYQLLPFGTGRRICLGQPLAVQAITILLAHLVHSFDWSLRPGEDPKDLDMSETFGVSAARRSPLIVIPTPRPSAALY